MVEHPAAFPEVFLRFLIAVIVWLKWTINWHIDVVSLFTNVPLERTIDIIIKKVYKEKRIKTKIEADKLSALLRLCTKEGHFTFNEETYIQVDGVMMGSPLGSLIEYQNVDEICR